MKHSSEFLSIVEKAKQNISQVTIDEVVAKQDLGEKFHFVDVREDDELRTGHAAGAVHIGKGVIERDIGYWDSNSRQNCVDHFVLWRRF
jgi:rhodanese-related sulfurtransferase